MQPRDRGTIVQVGSALAYQGIPLQAPYCGAKHAIKGMFESLRCELRNRGSQVHLTMVQLPGLNTPQFDHCLSKMPNHPQPVKPIFQPEVAARSIYWAAHHRRRELYVGLPTVYTIIGNKLAPWVAERYLAAKAVTGQQNDQPFDGARTVNLFEPVDSDHDEGAHGIFDGEAKPRSPQAWLSRHRLGTAVGGAATLAAGAVAALARRGA
jgi:NAD(P)-dependent dehydrogenase (short-subunit alcohol dehydrogenase family)